VDLWGLWDESLKKAVDSHANEVYKKGENDCDIWVEKVLNEAGKILPNNWSPAADTKAPLQIENLKNEIKNHLSLGANIAFHNNNHAMVVYINTDNTVNVAHITSNPNTLTNPDGNAEELKYTNIASFEKDWGGKEKLQYVSLEDARSNNPSVVRPTLSNGEQIPVGGKNQ
jgi:hypothetical protein